MSNDLKRDIFPHPDISLPRLRPWREMSTIGMMVMELCWMVPWYRSLTTATYAASPMRVFSVFGILLWLTHFIVRSMNYIHLKMNLRRRILSFLFLCFSLIAIKSLLYTQSPFSIGELIVRPMKALYDWNGLVPNEFLVILVVLFIGWRGIALAQAHISPQSVIYNFQIGILIFLLFILVNTIITGETFGGFPYLFLFAGLISMGAARLSVLSSLRGAPQTSFDRRWAIGMILAASFVVLVAFLVGHLTTRTLFLQWAVGLVFALLTLLTMILISPLIFLLPYLLERFKISSEIAKDIVSALESVRVLFV